MSTTALGSAEQRIRYPTVVSRASVSYVVRGTFVLTRFDRSAGYRAFASSKFFATAAFTSRLNAASRNFSRS